jgi:hypothetical protein
MRGCDFSEAFFVSAPDFYFAINAIFRHLHDQYGKEALIDYWRSLGQEYYRQRCQRWRESGPPAIAADWQEYFSHEPNAQVEATCEVDRVRLDVRVCPAIKHLSKEGRTIVPYFCEHCDHVTGAMAEQAGYTFHRTGGMGSCQQELVQQNRSATEAT